MSISMKRYNDTIITPKDDRILFDQIFDDYGLIYGGSATMSASNKIHVGAARGFIKGTEVIIEAEDIAVELSDSGTKNGRLKIVMDLADTETPIKFESEVATSFPALEQDANINYDNGRYEVAFATYKATETTISDVALVMPTMQSVKTKIQGINQSLTNINVNVGEDGKLHFVDSTGADTVLPFSNLKYFIKNGILQDGVVATPPKAYTTNNNCTTQNGYFLTYVGTSNSGYYCQINGIDLTDIDILIIAATCPQSGQNYWALFDSTSKVISTGKWTYVDVRTRSGMSFLRTYYGSLNIYNMFGMKFPE